MWDNVNPDPTHGLFIFSSIICVNKKQKTNIISENDRQTRRRTVYMSHKYSGGTGVRVFIYRECAVRRPATDN